MTKQQVRLSEADRSDLKDLISKGKQSIRVYRRAIGLLELDQGKSLGAVAKTVGVAATTVSNWRDKYKEIGLGCLQDAPRSGRPIEISGEQRAQIPALACSQAPEGHARWELRLLADKVVELGYCEHIAHTQVSNILKKTNSSLT